MKILARLFAVVCLSVSAIAQQPQAAEPNPEAIVKGNYQFTNGVAPGYWVYHYGTASLVVHVGKGTCFDSSEARHAYAGGTLTMTASATNYIYLATSSCTLSQNTTGYPVTGALPLATVVATSSVTSITDDRTWFNGTGGVAGCLLSMGVNAQTAGYTLLSGDAGKLVTFNGSSLTATLPSSPPSSTWCARIQNLNSSALTVSRNGLTINAGTSNLTLAQYQTVTCVTDGSNYFCTRPIAASTNVTITENSNVESIASSGGSGGVVPCTGGAGLAASYATTILGEGSLVNYWKINEAPGATTIADSKGSNTGTVSGGVTFGNVGCLGNGALFDGSSGSISVSRQIQDDFTIELWMKSTHVPGCDTIFYGFGQGLVGGEVSGVHDDFGVIYGDYSCVAAGNIVAGTGNPDVGIGSGTPVVSDGNWHYVVFTRKKSTGAINLYVDNVLNATGTGNTNSLTAPSTLFLGSDPNFYNGYMQQIAAYSTALSPTQINAHWLAAGGSTNGGTITEIDTGVGLTGGPITGSGTISLIMPSTGVVRSNGSALSGAELSGDATTSGSNAVTNAKVNGVSYPASPSTHTVPVVTASNTATYKTVPDCTDLTGNHLNYTQSTDSFSCGTSTSGGGGASGGLTLVEQHAASTSSELDFTTCISGTYDEYQIEAVNLIPASSGVSLLIRFSTNGGSSYDTSAIYNRQRLVVVGNAASELGNGSQTSLELARGNVGNAANYSLNGSWKLFNPGGSAYKLINGEVMFYDAFDNDGTQEIDQLGGAYRSTTAVNAFNVFFSSGNITSGTVRCYGVAK